MSRRRSVADLLPRPPSSVKRRGLLGSVLFALCLGLASAYPQQAPAQKLGPGFGQRYLVLATTRASTLQEELRLASAAGYRVIAAWSTNEVVDGRAHQEEKAAAEDCAEALRNVLLELKRQ